MLGISAAVNGWPFFLRLWRVCWLAWLEYVGTGRLHLLL